MFGLQFLNISPGIAFIAGVMAGMFLAWGIYEDFAANRPSRRNS